MPREKIESYILQMELPYEELDDSLWIIYETDDPNATKLVVSYEEEIVHFRLKVMDIPENKDVHCELFQKLLNINATGLTHGAFAIEEDSIVLLDTLQIENLDFNEFRASVESIFLGIIETYPDLSKYANQEAVSR